ANEASRVQPDPRRQDLSDSLHHADLETARNGDAERRTARPGREERDQPGRGLREVGGEGGVTGFAQGEGAQADDHGVSGTEPPVGFEPTTPRVGRPTRRAENAAPQGEASRAVTRCNAKRGAFRTPNQVRILEGQLTAELTARDPLKATQGVVMIGRRSIAWPTRSTWRCSGICAAGKRPNLLSRDYRGWPHFRLHSPRAERIREKSPVTPSARSVQTKK